MTDERLVLADLLAQDPSLDLTPRAADDRRCADWSRNRGDKRLLAEFEFARSVRLRCDADRQVAISAAPPEAYFLEWQAPTALSILPCSGLRK